MGTLIAIGHQTMRTNSGSLAVWLRLAAVLLSCADWLWPRGCWPPRIAVNLDEFAGWLAAHRHAWYALPLVDARLRRAGTGMVPVILLIAATGIAFGPVLGPVYAMAGCLASASTGFAIGRWMGLRRVTQLGGERIARVTRALKRNGTLAVFLVRKVPAPFTLVNIVVGASTIRFRDFIVGTVLGMGAVRRRPRRVRISSDQGVARSVAGNVDRRGAVRWRAADAGVADQPRVAATEAGRMIGTAPRVERDGGTLARQNDCPARKKLLARRARVPLLLHSGCRRLLPPGPAGPAQRPQDRVQPGLGHHGAHRSGARRSRRRTRRRGSTSCSPLSRGDARSFAATS